MKTLKKLAVLIILAVFTVHVAQALSGVSLSIPGTYGGFRENNCKGGDTYIDVSFTVSQLHDDSANIDSFGSITWDASGNVIDAAFFTILANTPTPTSVGFLISPGYDDLPDPVSRPFTTVIFDLPTVSTAGIVHSSQMFDLVHSYGTEVARITFDPAFAPGCALLPLANGTCIDIPTGSVVGSMPSATQAYYTPGSVSPGVVINPGTYWVVGVDASGQYYKIILACQYLWVPITSLQPSDQPPQNGAPLPTRVVS